jgi:hypothetical protein
LVRLLHVDSGVRFESSNRRMLTADFAGQLRLWLLAADAKGPLCCATLPQLIKTLALSSVE